jgi:hypothetical protein
VTEEEKRYIHARRDKGKRILIAILGLILNSALCLGLMTLCEPYLYGPYGLLAIWGPLILWFSVTIGLFVNLFRWRCPQCDGFYLWAPTRHWGFECAHCGLPAEAVGRNWRAYLASI